MFKIAIYKGKEIAREKATSIKFNGKFDFWELNEFNHRISKNINYDNSKEIEFYCKYAD